MNWLNVLFNILTIIATLIGFYVAYQQTLKSIKAEISKMKMEYGLNKIADSPLAIVELMEDIIKENFTVDKFNKVVNNIYAYGSVDAIRIVAEIKHVANGPADTVAERSRDWLVLYSLLVSQIKYDLTGEIVSPELWFEIKIDNYADSIKPLVRASLKRYVAELKLNKDILKGIE